MSLSCGTSDGIRKLDILAGPPQPSGPCVTSALSVCVWLGQRCAARCRGGWRALEGPSRAFPVSQQNPLLHVCVMRGSPSVALLGMRPDRSCLHKELKGEVCKLAGTKQEEDWRHGS